MSSRVQLACPKCGSHNVCQTTLGTIGRGRYDSANRARCEACKHAGTLGDWELIATLKMRVHTYEEILAQRITSAYEERRAQRFLAGVPLEQGNQPARQMPPQNARDALIADAITAAIEPVTDPVRTQMLRGDINS